MTKPNADRTGGWRVHEPCGGGTANKSLMKLLGLQRISVMLRNIMALGSKSSGLGIRDPMEVIYESHQTSKACNKRLVESLLTGEALSTVEHRACVRRVISDGREIKKER